MRPRCAPLIAVALSAVCARPRRRNPARRAPLRLRAHEPARRRRMQDDDTANPGMLWVLDGEALWSRKAGAANRACADCHGDARAEHEGRRGALSRPSTPSAGGRSTSSSASTSAAPSSSRRPPLALESKELLALTAYVAHQSRGMPIDESTTRGSSPSRSRARALRSPPGPAQPLLRAMPRRQLGPAARRQHDPAGAPDRLSALSPGMAGARLAAAAPAQLPDRHARRDLRLRRARVRRAGGFPDVARARHADGDPGGATVAAAPPGNVKLELRRSDRPVLEPERRLPTCTSSASLNHGRSDENLESPASGLRDAGRHRNAARSGRDFP